MARNILLRRLRSPRPRRVLLALRQIRRSPQSSRTQNRHRRARKRISCSSSSFRSGKIMRRLLKAVLTGAPLGDTSTIEDEGSIEDIKATYNELRKQLAK